MSAKKWVVAFGVLLALVIVFGVGRSQTQTSGHSCTAGPHYQVVVAGDWSPFVVDQCSGQVWRFLPNQHQGHFVRMYYDTESKTQDGQTIYSTLPPLTESSGPLPGF